MVILQFFWKKLASYYGNLLKYEKENGASRLKVWYSEMVYHVFVLFTKFVRGTMKASLDIGKIRRYYSIYGRDDTMSHFGLSEQAMDEVLSA